MGIGKSIAIAMSLCAVMAASFNASAAVNVGDKPDLKVGLVGGGTLDLQKSGGKIILLDFWATWCGPCMKEMPHMIELNNKYGPKGLQIVGISWDRDAGTMMNVAKQTGMTWPQHLDTGSRVGQQFGVNSIPRVFLLSPDGEVLWTGHPASGLDKQIEKAFKEHPPQLVDPQVLAAAKEMLTEAQAKADAGDMQAAIKALGKVAAEARADADFAAQADELGKKLEAAADEMLTEIDKLVSGGDFVGAAERLKSLSVGLGASPIGVKAKGKLTELLARPEAKAAISKAEKESRAAEALTTAQKLKADGKDEIAYPRFKSVAKDFAGTPAAADAAKVVAEYEKDSAFVSRVIEKEAGAKARGKLSVARSYVKTGNLELARKNYQQIISDFPGTSFAETATKEMSELK